MKKITSFLLTFLLIFNFAACNTSSLVPPDEITINLQIDNPVMTVSGKNAEIDPGLGTTPVIVNDRTLVPIRAIIETFGGVVSWNAETRTAALQIEDDVIFLTIDSETAYLNDTAHSLDVAPAIINNRTMLPIRFVSENFGFGVSWDGKERIVTIVKKTEPLPENYVFDAGDVPEFFGSPYASVNSNVPLFDENELKDESFEYYSELDYLGRCGECVASISEDIMPTEDRGNISSVKPTGWQSITYDNVDGKYLYNRCHLLGFQLTGENANKKNLITGTRYLNVDGMLPFEDMIDDYVEATDNHVMYRVTPVFEGNNLVASGVLLEAYSVEDNGEGLSFCVYCYNVQPGVEINYADGTSKGAHKITETVEQNNTSTAYFVLNINSKKFHYPTCSGVKSMKEANKEISYDTSNEIMSRGYAPCGICKPQ